MTSSDLIGLGGLLLTCLVAAGGVVNWLKKGWENARRRDVELLSWGDKAIVVFARLETIFEFPRDGDHHELRQLAGEASALVDQGRLFFPNVKVPESDPLSAEVASLRDTILDELVRAYLLAKDALVREPQREIFKVHARAARRRFVDKLQKAMGKSLRQPSKDRAGQSIPRDPRRWRA